MTPLEGDTFATLVKLKREEHPGLFVTCVLPAESTIQETLMFFAGKNGTLETSTGFNIGRSTSFIVGDGDDEQ